MPAPTSGQLQRAIFKMKVRRNFNKPTLKPYTRKAVNKIVKKAITKGNVTKKYIQNSLPTIGDLMGFIDMTLVGTGTSNYQRDSAAGNQITVKRIHVSGQWLPLAGTINKAIIYVFLWRPDVSVDPPTTGDFLDNDGTIQAPFTGQRPDSKQRAIVLYKSHIFDLKNVVGTVYNTPSFDFWVNNIDKKILYHSADALGTTGTNHIFLGVVSDSTGSNPTFLNVTECYFQEQ